MAILKDLIVHGSSRFLNKIYASEIQTPLIEAEAGIIKKLKADDVTVVGLLDVQGQLHTNSWTNSNIATIDGSFYITPTIECASGTLSSLTVNTNTPPKHSFVLTAATGSSFAVVNSLYYYDTSAHTVTWAKYSKVLITGEILVGGEWIPLGTILGQLNADGASGSISIFNGQNNKHGTSTVLAELTSTNITSAEFRNLKISLYQRSGSTTTNTDAYKYPLGIYLTALGQNGKTFLDIYGGVNALTTSYGGYANPNVRIGNLSGLPAITTAAGNFTPVGWGIYTTNGYFSGTIVSNTGVIGGWKLGANSLFNGTTGLNNTTVGIYLGTDGIRNYKDTDTYVNITEGVITAKGVNLTGTINATEGNIGGATITGGNLTVPAAKISGELTAATINGSKITANSITAGQIAASAITADELAANAVTSAKIKAGEVKADNIAANAVTAGKISVDNLSAITANLGTITAGVIKHDTVGGTNGIWLSADTDTSSNITVGESTARKDWRLLVNNKFGVTKTGDLYASSANISGTITATDGTIGGINIVDGALDVSSISIGNLNGASSYAQKTDVTQAIDNIEVGGRNLLKYDVKNYGITSSEIIALPKCRGMYFSCEGNQTYTISRKQVEGNRFYIATTTEEPVDGLACNVIFDENPSILKYTFTTPSTAKYVFIYLSNNNDIINNGNIKAEKGNKATDWTPAPEDTQESINSVSTTANTALGQSVWYAECPTAAGTAVKVATVSPVTTAFPNPLVNGTTVNVKFTKTNSATNTSLKLNVNGTGEKSIKYIYNGAITDIVAGYLKANQMYQFRYDGTYWIVQMMRNTNDDHYDRSLYGVALAASAAISAGRIAVLGVDNKLHLLNTTSFNITCPPLYVATAYTTANVSSAATKTSNYTYWGTAFNLANTHSIANTAANTNVYIVGTLSGDIFTPNTTVLTCAEPTTENGLYYMLLGRMTSTTNAVLQAEHPIYVFKNGQFQKLEATTATNYITQIDNTGIKIAPYDKSGNDYLQLNSDAISMYRNNIETLRIEDSAIRVGKANEAHFSLTSSRLTGYGNNNNIYFDVGQGDNTAIQLFYGNGDRTGFEMGPLVKGTSQYPKGIKSVKKDGNALTETTDYTIHSASIWYDIYFEKEPAAYSTITIEYISAYKELLYTVGSSQNITTSQQTFPDGHVATLVTLDSQKTYEAKELWVKKSGQTEWQQYQKDSYYHVEQINNNYKYYLYVDTGTQIKLVYFILDDSSFVSDPDVQTEEYLWDITHQGSLSLTVKNVYKINSVKVNNTNVNYTSEGPLYYDYLVFSTAPALNEKIEVEFFTRNYNSQYYSTYLNFSNMNKENSVKGIGAVSFGSENVNKGVFCLVEGASNTVTGYASHAEGYNNVVAGSHAHVGGTNSLALGQNTFVHGDNLQATYLNSAAFGYYNNPENQLFSIGRGNYENAFSINKDGNIQIGGGLLAGATYADKKPLFKIIQRTFTGHGIGGNGGMAKARDISIPGYRPIASLGYVIANSSGHPTSSQTSASWCILSKFWIGYDYTQDHQNYKTDSIYYYIWNLNTNNSRQAIADVTFRILYIAQTAYIRQQTS